MNDDDNRPGLGTIGAILGGIVLFVFAALIFMGGQVSTVLSNVGNSISSDCCGAGAPVGEQGVHVRLGHFLRFRSSRSRSS